MTGHADLAPFYTTTDPHNAAELRCMDHPDWYADADGTALPTLIRRAQDHLNDDHQAAQP